jgi:hypothetical protein
MKRLLPTLFGGKKKPLATQSALTGEDISSLSPAPDATEHATTSTPALVCTAAGVAASSSAVAVDEGRASQLLDECCYYKRGICRFDAHACWYRHTDLSSRCHFGSSCRVGVEQRLCLTLSFSFSHFLSLSLSLAAHRLPPAPDCCSLPAAHSTLSSSSCHCVLFVLRWCISSLFFPLCVCRSHQNLSVCRPLSLSSVAVLRHGSFTPAN